MIARCTMVDRAHHIHMMLSHSCRLSHLILSGHQTNMLVVGRGGVVSGAVSSAGDSLVSSLTEYLVALN